MPFGPIVSVTTQETPGSAGVSFSTGTLFLAAEAAYGPEVPQRVNSLKEAEFYFGPRAEAASQEAFDYLNTFFSLGGNKAYVNRALGAGSKFSEIANVESTGAKKALVFESRFKGTFANKLSAEVLASGAVVVFVGEEIVEQTPAATKASEIFEYFSTHTAYIVVKEGTEYAGAKGEQLKVLAKKAFSGGVNPTVTEATVKTAIEGFPRNLGPGQLGVSQTTNAVKEAIHTAMGEHGQKNNRIALCDLKEAAKAGVTVATLSGEKGSYSVGISPYMIFTSSTCVVQGVTLGTTRTVPGSAVVAGLCARVALGGNNAANPSGKEFSLAPFVQSFTNNFKQPEIEELSEKGINSFNEVQGTPCLFGFVSAIPKSTNKVFWQATSGRERMALVGEAEEVGASYEFKTIDGRKQLIGRFQGDLQGIIQRHWLANALFGATAPEAGIAVVGEPINTTTTIQNGELNAEMIVRISPFAQIVNIKITTAPITESV